MFSVTSDSLSGEVALIKAHKVFSYSLKLLVKYKLILNNSSSIECKFNLSINYNYIKQDLNFQKKALSIKTL